MRPVVTSPGSFGPPCPPIVRAREYACRRTVFENGLGEGRPSADQHQIVAVDHTFIGAMPENVADLIAGLAENFCHLA